MKSMIKFFAERHILATLITVMILLLGINSLRTLKRDLYPHVDFGQVEISTVYPGASPEDVELNVTNKIEDELKSVTGIARITSTSMENISAISIMLDPDAKAPGYVELRIAGGLASSLPASFGHCGSSRVQRTRRHENNGKPGSAFLHLLLRLWISHYCQYPNSGVNKKAQSDLSRCGPGSDGFASGFTFWCHPENPWADRA